LALFRRETRVFSRPIALKAEAGEEFNNKSSLSLRSRIEIVKPIDVLASKWKGKMMMLPGQMEASPFTFNFPLKQKKEEEGAASFPAEDDDFFQSSSRKFLAPSFPENLSEASRKGGKKMTSIKW